jgi:hypothetical protein
MRHGPLLAFLSRDSRVAVAAAQRRQRLPPPDAEVRRRLRRPPPDAVAFLRLDISLPRPLRPGVFDPAAVKATAAAAGPAPTVKATGAAAVVKLLALYSITGKLDFYKV